MNIDQSIKFLEAEMERLRHLKEQEKAMAEVLPIRFEKNMEAFSRFIPAIYEQFREYTPQRLFRFICNENGIPNLLWLDDNTIVYGMDPFQDAKDQIDKILTTSSIETFKFGLEADLFDQIHVQYLNKICELYSDVENDLERLKSVPESIPMVMMFGLGLGYQLSYLYERCSVKNLFVFEPDLDFFYASLFSFDWHSLLSHLSDEGHSIHLFIGQDEDSLMEDLLPVLHKRGAFWISSTLAFWHYSSEKIFSLVERIKKEFYTLKSGWGFFDDNLFALAHSASNLERKVPFLLKGKRTLQPYPNLPVLVIGNGPSLDEAIPFIKENQDKFLLLSCGSSITALHRSGIKPDVILAVERTKSSADFLRLLNDDEYLKDILFLSVDVIHPECHRYFDRMALGFKPYEPMHSLLLNNTDYINNHDYLNGVNPFVGNTGLSYAIALGFEKIFLCGIDNGYKNAQHHHSKYSAYYDTHGQPIEGLTQLVTKNSDMVVPGNFGGTVTANRLFCVSIKSMESLLKNNPSVTCYNCSDGAAVKGTLPLKINDIDIDSVIINKKSLVDYIYSNFFSPIEINRKSLIPIMGFEIFDELLSKMISDWRAVEPTRVSISNLMQKHFDYLVFLSRTKHTHIHRVMVGSINYFFSFINSIIYSFDDKDMSVKITQPAIDIMIEFFEKAKKLYPDALDFIDSSDCEILKLYRKG